MTDEKKESNDEKNTNETLARYFGPKELTTQKIDLARLHARRSGRRTGKGLMKSINRMSKKKSEQEEDKPE